MHLIDENDDEFLICIEAKFWSSKSSEDDTETDKLRTFQDSAVNVLGIESRQQNHHALAKVLERVEAKSTTHERAKATEALGFFGDVKFY